ncbi:hypothetical protein Hanom_Chr02g00148771 [Helianthus anomalus]
MISFVGMGNRVLLRFYTFSLSPRGQNRQFTYVAVLLLFHGYVFKFLMHGKTYFLYFVQKS